MGSGSIGLKQSEGLKAELKADMTEGIREDPRYKELPMGIQDELVNLYLGLDRCDTGKVIVAVDNLATLFAKFKNEAVCSGKNPIKACHFAEIKRGEIIGVVVDRLTYRCGCHKGGHK